MGKKIAGRRLEISGVVQGVGFRPFLYGLAMDHGLVGQVSNTAAGVDAVIEGPLEAIEDFIRDIREKPPLLARVDRVVSKDTPVRGFSGFSIVKSRASNARSTLISPDVCTCADCLAEMRNPDDRRFEYPFINCTNCGPRFTIIRDIPYDRPKTSMHSFQMCSQCQKEYENPLDRRFHAQPNACPQCGPRVFLTDNQGKELPVNQGSRDGEIIAEAGNLLRQGHILGIKGLGGFHLAVNAADDGAVQRLRKLKNRPHKPFALMARSASSLSDHVHLSGQEKELLFSFHRPIVLLEKKDPSSNAGLSQALAPMNTCLGVMLPYTPLHFLLLEKGPSILVMTSGNRSGEPLSIDNDDALDAFSHIADYFLLHDRDIYFRADDSITRIQAGKQRFIRRSRGFSPLPVELAMDLPPILGCGAGLKSIICLTRGRSAFLSQHIGDLENRKITDYFVRSMDHLKKILDIEPVLAAHDLHPGYFSTQYAENLAEKGLELCGVQHHHAHAVSCMAENHMDGEVIALVLDGTGYGIDGHIWGGEVLTCTHGDFQRKAHLSYVPMPGGDAAVLEPWRMTASMLFQAYGRDFLDMDLEYIREMDRGKLEFICQMMEKNLNSPLTSSAGRIFDAVSSLLCIRHQISHESQAAMELEAVAAGDESGTGRAYDFTLESAASETLLEINLIPCLRQITGDLARGVPLARISRKFHGTLVKAFVRAAGKTAEQTGLDRVVLSGGVFNNNIILTQMIRSLEEIGLRVYTQSKVPCGDGGISLGQVVSAGARMK
ncbi:carbamoyltransferase HypF [Desulfospira joergensenii]|uniref:carbamoyltransferase HypF n=1 Tax=Desulfospira joergensenii TaxID=53329 RepID=UPI0003B44C90|nr:carbamoyltransferase HypF [Desulfospira joergensenii]